MTDPLIHREILTALFAEVAGVAAELDLCPSGVMVRTYEVNVQIPDEDTAAVDNFADRYGIGPDEDPESSIYMREGRATIAGRSVTLRVYSGRPGVKA